jgi:hypothetical protein
MSMLDVSEVVLILGGLKGKGRDVGELTHPDPK